MWKPLLLDAKRLVPAVEDLHHAAQFVAMVGDSYLPKRADDSQNNLNWNQDTCCLEGRWIEEPAIRVLLDVLNFELVLDKYLTMETIPLEGGTKDQVIGNLIHLLKMERVNPAILRPISQFEISRNKIDEGASFSKPPREILEEWTRYQSNALGLLKEIKEQFELASEIRVWPHHFDMGLYIPLSRDETGHDLQSVGLGLSIADNYVKEPYFYVNHWNKEPLIYPEIFPKANQGYWNTKDWKGLILPSSEIFAQSAQEGLVRSFLENGLRITRELLKQKTLVAD